MQSVTTERITSARSRITQVFQYLEALDQRRNPAKANIKEQPWVYWLRELPKHPSIQTGTMEDSGFILKIKRPTITQPPSPSKLIEAWIKLGWKDINGKPAVLEAQNQTGKDNETIIIRFDDDLTRVEQFQNWKIKWEQWQINEKPVRDVLRLFERIYGLYGDIDRDAEKVELVLGDGILNWRLDSGDVHHPVLLTRVQLEFDPKIPEFTLVETERPVEFYTAIFRRHPSIEGQRIGKLREELEEGGFHPLGQQDTSGFLTRLVRTLSPNGEFVGSGEPQGLETYPRIGREPVLFLRARTLGFATALDAIIQTLKNEDLDLILPTSLVNIVGVETEAAPDNGASAEGSICYANEDESILLSKPANPEQLQIARRLEKFGSVLVQGPPGTGKTHTIANLIGHLLAQGKSILVTSHTTKALSVLRDQVVPELQPLCVSSLESDTQSRAQLENSINSIVQRLASSDSTRLKRDIEELTKRREALLSQLTASRLQLLEARTDEYRSVIVDGHSITPTSAAKKVAEGSNTDSWIPSPVLLGSALPLSIEELIELYASNGIISQEDEEVYALSLPKLESLIEPFEFDQIAESHKQLENEIVNKHEHLWSISPEKQTSELLQSLLKKVTKASVSLGALSQWELNAIEAGRRGGPHLQPWESLLNLIESVTNDAVNAKDILFKFDPQLADDVALEDQEVLISKIVEFLGNGQKLNWFNLIMHKQWKSFILKLKANRRVPESLEEFQALCTKARLEIKICMLRERWDRQMGSLGGPTSAEFRGSVEEICTQYKPLIQKHLVWYFDSWKPLIKDMVEAGLLWTDLWESTPPQLREYGDFYRLHTALADVPEILKERISFIQKLNLEKTFETLTVQINSDSQQTPITAAIREALCTRDTEAYRLIHTRLVRLHNNMPVYDRRNYLIKKLEPAAKGWVMAFRARSSVHANKEMPGNPESAWLWRQWQDELERRASTSIDSIQKEIENLSEELKKTTTRLIDVKAWLAQVNRTTTPQRQALMGWLQTMNKIGAGKGKRVPRLLVEARNLMQKSRSAVPVWIMPLSKVVENFDFNSTRFDVVIIDEASQSDVMGLVALYLGKQIVIVGDHKQVSPLAIGQKIEEVEHLIAEFLNGIPNAHLYDGKTSVYDLATQSFSGLICLKEHFRCVPEIIQFSNWLSYDGEIKPLRDSASVTIRPSVIPYQVLVEHLEENKLNRTEAITVASLVKACIDKPEYADKNFGIISLLGEEQATCIDTFLRSKLEPAQYERHKIRCGISAQFQGDERDVVFLSMVDRPLIDGPHRMRQEDMYKQRYNVAVSRAKDQLWVIHSLQHDVHLKAGDLRRQLLEYAYDPKEFVRQLEHGEHKTESEFERLVFRSLRSRSFKVTPQWKVGYYRIDMVVEGDGKRLAIECDGERYHPPEKLPEDMARQANLERMGWRFLRIRGSEFFRNPERTMHRVFEKLQEVEIYPSETPEIVDIDESIQNSELLKQIRRDAEAIRQQWQEDEPSINVEVNARQPDLFS